MGISRRPTVVVRVTPTLTIIQEEVMEMSAIDRNVQEQPGARKLWEAPAIALERPLETQAQGIAPPSSPDVAPLIGPFGTSGVGLC